MYQNAIETNFSHEQMGPLNSILNISKIIMKLTRQLNSSDRSNQAKYYKDMQEFINKSIDLNQ